MFHKLLMNWKVDIYLHLSPHFTDVGSLKKLRYMNFMLLGLFY